MIGLILWFLLFVFHDHEFFRVYRTITYQTLYHEAGPEWKTYYANQQLKTHAKWIP